MEVTHPDQLTGPIIRRIREEAGKTQAEFWGPLGVSKGRASTYESEKYPINESAKLLVYLHHVCGFPLGLPHDSMVIAAKVAAKVSDGCEAVRRAIAIAEAGADDLRASLACMEA